MSGTRGQYAKVYRALWDGTLGTQGDAWPIFVFLLAHCDADGVVNMTPAAIAGRAGWDAARVRAALDSLEAPDPDSKTPDHNGARIVRLDGHRSWGWQIVNYQAYRESSPAERKADWRMRHPEEADLEALRKRDARRHTASHGVTRRRQAEAEAEVEAEAQHPTLSLPVEEGVAPIDLTLGIPLCDGTDFHPSSNDLTEWSALYGAVDVRQELRKMRGHWLASPRPQRKTRQGVKRSINRWLAIEQERKSGRGAKTPTAPGRRAGADRRYFDANQAAERQDGQKEAE